MSSSASSSHSGTRSRSLPSSGADRSGSKPLNSANAVDDRSIEDRLADVIHLLCFGDHRREDFAPHQKQADSNLIEKVVATATDPAKKMKQSDIDDYNFVVSTISSATQSSDRNDISTLITNTCVKSSNSNHDLATMSALLSTALVCRGFTVDILKKVASFTAVISSLLRRVKVTVRLPLCQVFRKNLLMNTFPNVLASIEDTGTLYRRHRGATSSSSSWEYEPRRNEDELTRVAKNDDDDATQIAAVWQNQHYGRVLIIKGPSGHGKTLFALEMATLTFEKPAFCVYFKPSNNIANQLDDISEKGARNNVDGIKKRGALDKAVKDFVMEKVFSLIGGDGGTTHTSWKGRLRYNPDQSNRHLVIVIDEIGKSSPFLRRLTSVSKQLSNELHELLFGETVVGDGRNNNSGEDTNGNNNNSTAPVQADSSETSAASPTMSNRCVKYSRVHFVAAGTGSHFGSSRDGSENDTMNDCVYLKPSGSIYSSFLKKALNAFKTRRPVAASFEKMLLDLGRPTPDESKAERVVSDTHSVPLPPKSGSAVIAFASNIVRNARCAVIFVRLILRHANKEIIADEVEYFGIERIPQIELLRSVIEETTETFIDLNALQRLTKDSTDVVGLAVAVSALRFETLPNGDKEFIKKVLKEDEDNKATIWTLPSLLCSTGGVLVDCANVTEKGIEGTGEVTLFETFTEKVRMDSDDIKTVTLFVIGKEKESRFDCQTVFTSMFLCRKIGSVLTTRGDDSWGGLEIKLADLATTVSHSSAIIDATYYTEKQQAQSSNDNVDAAASSSSSSSSSSSTPASPSLLSPASLRGIEDRDIDSLITFKRDWLIFGENNTGKRFRQRVLGANPNNHQLQNDSLFEYPNITNSEQIYAGKGHYANLNYDSTDEAEWKTYLQEFRENIFYSGTVLVIIFPPRTAFADIVILGPYKVVLVQAKPQRWSKKEINYDEEFRKMGVYAPSYDDKNCCCCYEEQCQFLDYLKMMCVRPNEESYSEFVQVCACVVVEGDESTKWTSARDEYRVLNERMRSMRSNTDNSNNINSSSNSGELLRHSNCEIAVFGFDPTASSSSFRESPMYPIPTTILTREDSS